MIGFRPRVDASCRRAEARRTGPRRPCRRRNPARAPGLVTLLRSLSPRSSGERATASGAVSAGSNPAGGTGQRHNSNTQTILSRSGANSVTCGNAQPFRTLRPIRARKADTRLERACSAVLGDNGPQAVAMTADRCSSQYPQVGSGSTGTARARLSSPPDRLDATWPTSHSVIGPLILRAPEPPFWTVLPSSMD